MKSALLAKAGFRYKGPGDNVYCSGCNEEFKHWKATDDPFVIHALRCPECPFVLDQRESGGYCPAAEVIISRDGHPPHLVLKAFLRCKESEQSLLHNGFTCISFNSCLTANTATEEQDLLKVIDELKRIEKPYQGEFRSCLQVLTFTRQSSAFHSECYVRFSSS